MTCSACSGGDDKCATCGGTGYEDSLRCPVSILGTDAQQVIALLDSYRAWKDGHLPAPGAWLDQSAVWARWMRIIESEASKIEAERAKRARAKAGR